MSLIALKGLSLTRGATLFAGLDLSIAKGDRLGFVAANGRGKSSLLRIMAGAEEATTAVTDKVVLDLKYEARDVPQRLTNQATIDAWFEQKTKGLNNFQKAVLRKRWANMEDLMSAEERKARIIAEIIQDFSLKPRLNDDRGTAILVAASIYDACHYCRLFRTRASGIMSGSSRPTNPTITRSRASRRTATSATSSTRIRSTS